MNALPQIAPPTPIRRFDPERQRLEDMVEELAALVANEHSLRTRAEAAADRLTVMLTRAMAETDEARADRDRAEEVAAEMAILLAKATADRD